MQNYFKTVKEHFAPLNLIGGLTIIKGLEMPDYNKTLMMFNRIRTWAHDRGLYEKGNPMVQYVKLQEEAGELAKALLKDDQPEVIDAIGDMVVVLTNLAHQRGVYIEECIQTAYEVINKRTGKMINGTFVKDEIKTKDKIVQQVLRKMDERSLIGQKKYGATMMQEIEGQEKDLNRFLVDVQEELMDALLYIEAAKSCLQDEIEESMLKRINIIAQNGNTGEHYDFESSYNIDVNNEDIL